MPKLNFKSSMIAKCLRVLVRLTMLLLNIRPGWFLFEVLWPLMISWACFFGSGLKVVSHCRTYSFKTRMKYNFSLSINQRQWKKTKYQQYFHCFICFCTSFISILVSLLVEYGNYSDKRCRGAALMRGEVLIRGKRLFQCGYSKLRRLLEGGDYLGPGSIWNFKLSIFLFLL